MMHAERGCQKNGGREKSPPFLGCARAYINGNRRKRGEGGKKMYGGAFFSGQGKNEACLLADKTSEL